MHTVTISAAQLQGLIASGQPLLILDLSFDLANTAWGEEQFLAAHIPGAAYAHLDRDLSAAHGDASAASGGRHPLPAREALARWLAAAGLNPDTQVVVYDRNGTMTAGRGWWMTQWAGHEAVAVLDGGWNAWLAAGGATENGPARARPAGSFRLAAPLAELRTLQQVHGALGEQGRQTLIDARATPRYLGDMEPLDPIAGHIPGALNRPFGSNLQADGLFKPAAQLRAEFEQLLAGADPASVVHHCGSGVSAVPNILAMELAGLGRRPLFAGSWSEWSNTPGMPCAKG